MSEYKYELTARKPEKIYMNTKNLNMEMAWPNHLINKSIKGSIYEEYDSDFQPDFSQISHNHEDKTMFSDDTGIAFNNTNDIIKKLTIYDQITMKYQLLVNWDKVFILIPKGNNDIPNVIKTFPHPYNQIKCVNKGKILGHMMEPDKKMNISVYERIRKAKNCMAPN